MATETKVLLVSDDEKSKLANIFATAGLDGNFGVVGSENGKWIFDAGSPAAMALAEYALAH